MIIDALLREAIKAGASDFHLVAGMPPVVRVDGELKDLNKKAVTAKEIELIVKEIIGDTGFKRFSIEREFDFAYEDPNHNRFRVNISWEKGCISLSARSIPENIPSLEDIAMPEVIVDLCKLDRGLILVTGPTGCGKSTTLAAMIDYINKTRRANIITLEDPTEFIFKPEKSIIRQRQLGTDMVSFQSGLIHALRQDPDVIMVGEMRDLATIAATITLAETGHLVFATLHTYSAAQTIDRIIDVFPPHQQNQIRSQVSITLKSIISQRLLPKPKGIGRVAAREVLINTSAIANLIRENKVAQIPSAIQTGGKDKMVTMDNSLKELYEKGEITKETYEANLMPDNQSN
jgi:twitching motility protein PilT